MEILFRTATKQDLTEIINLLLDDMLGSQRENSSDPSVENYQHAFEEISNDSNQELTVAVMEGEIVGTFQLSFLQYLTYQGGLRCQVEAVRVKSSHRGQGIGEKMMTYILDRAKSKGAHLVQLTSDKKRPEALRFYESLGFVSSHEGMKLHL